jgi:hypothetical protein
MMFQESHDPLSESIHRGKGSPSFLRGADPERDSEPSKAYLADPVILSEDAFDGISP